MDAAPSGTAPTISSASLKESGVPSSVSASVDGRELQCNGVS